MDFVAARVRDHEKAIPPDLETFSAPVLLEAFDEALVVSAGVREERTVSPSMAELLRLEGSLAGACLRPRDASCVTRQSATLSASVQILERYAGLRKRRRN